MFMALTIAVLMAGAVYLVLQRGMVRIVCGMSLFSHGVNLMLLATGVGSWRAEAFYDTARPEDMADPLPQAFVLTAIVISMATTTIMLAMASLGKNDDTGDGPGVEGPEIYSKVDEAEDPFSTLGRDSVRLQGGAR